MWGAFNLLIGFGGTIVLARMLLPRDFGIVAIGMTLTIFATTLSDGGLGSGLIRRPESPTRPELRAVLGLQLTLTGAIALVVAACASFFGSSGLVVAVMMLALPIVSVQTPGKIVLARALRFRVLTAVEAIGVVAYYGWAVGWVIAGAGVWALATGVVVRALAATLALAVASPGTAVSPSYRQARSLWPVIAFGARFQANSVAGMLREQGLNGAVGLLAGVGTLGLWTLAKRLLEIPLLVIEPLHRVAFPYMSQIRAVREDPGPLIERGMRVTATAAGVVLTGLAASAPGLVPGLFGEQWRESAVAVQWVCASLLVTAPLAVVAVGFLYAAGEPAVVLRATILHTLTLFAVAFPLLPFAGIAAIGAGSLAGAVVDALVVGRAVGRLSSARPLPLLVTPFLLASPAAILGAVVTTALGNDLMAGVAGGLVGSLAYTAGALVFRRDALIDTASLVLRSIREGVARSSAPPAPATG